MLVSSNHLCPMHSADLKLLARLLSELYSTQSNYHYRVQIGPHSAQLPLLITIYRDEGTLIKSSNLRIHKPTYMSFIKLLLCRLLVPSLTLSLQQLYINLYLLFCAMNIDINHVTATT